MEKKNVQITCKYKFDILYSKCHEPPGRRDDVDVVTWQDEGDPPRTDPPVLGAIGEGAEAEHDPCEAAQHRQQHEGPGGVPESCRHTHTHTHSRPAFTLHVHMLVFCSCLYFYVYL